MDKPSLVKLPKYAVEKIEFCLARITKEQMLKAHRDEQRLPSVLNELEFDQLAQALYIGYEVEQTPEDKVRDYYNDIAEASGKFTPEDVTGIIRNVLDTLNIKIKGVNE